jgi:type I restriction enzyme S subunit
MTSWPAKRLSEICERVTDGSHRTPSFTETGYPFVTVAHIDSNGQIDFSACKRISVPDFEDLKKNDCRPLPGDVLFSKDGTVGKTAVIDFDKDFVVLSSLAILRPKSDVVSQRFLAYALRSDQVLSQAINRKSGSAIRRIVLRDLSQVSMPVPPLAEQQRIVKLMDEAEELRRLRAQANHRTADIIPALFHEMFGGPNDGWRGHPNRQLQDICRRITDGTHQPPPFAPKGIPFLFVRNIVRGSLDFDTEKFISEATFANLTKTVKPERGDILYSTVGSYGVAVEVDTDRQFAFQRHIGHLKPNHELIDSSFLAAQLNTPWLRLQADRSARGVAQKTVNLAEMRKFSVVVPPLALQKKFTGLVADIRRLQAKQATSRDRLEKVFQSLLHRAFRGELKFSEIRQNSLAL